MLGRFCAEPWPHYEFDEFLPAEMAREIADRWPRDGYRWLKHSDILKDDGTSLRKYQPLAQSFPEVAEFIRNSPLCEFDLTGLYPQLLLVEDLPGYRIRRHTDCAGKALSAQVYLPDDEDHHDQGVILEGQSERKQVPYSFNHGYAFKVTNHSFHRVLKSTTRRRSIQVIYYSTPNPRI